MSAPVSVASSPPSTPRTRRSTASVATKRAPPQSSISQSPPQAPSPQQQTQQNHNQRTTSAFSGAILPRTSIHTHHDPPASVVVYGYLLLFGLLAVFSAIMYACVISQFMPPLGHRVLDWWREDTYYSLLIPLLVPVLILTAYLNWLGLKLFRHN